MTRKCDSDVTCRNFVTQTVLRFQNSNDTRSSNRLTFESLLLITMLKHHFYKLETCQSRRLGDEYHPQALVTDMCDTGEATMDRFSLNGLFLLNERCDKS